MKILFITISWSENGRNLYTDLMRTFKEHGHDITVVHPREKRVNKETACDNIDGIKIIHVKTGNIIKTPFIEKGISLSLLNRQFFNAIKLFSSGENFDLIICSTPTITLSPLITQLKHIYHCKVYLMLKDMWPQAMVDLGVFKKGSFVWKIFRTFEMRMYFASDYIGCMSQAGVDYIRTENPYLDPDKIEVCPNSVEIINNPPIDIKAIRAKFKLPENAIIFIFDGNMDIPQRLYFLTDTIEKLTNRTDIFFLLIGAGTHYQAVKDSLAKIQAKNAVLYDKIPKEEYEELTEACDVGMILLDSKYTAPEFPSKLLSYLQTGKPVLCAVNQATDIGRIVEEAGCGKSVLHGDMDNFIKAILDFADNKDKLSEMNINARKLLENEYTTENSYNVIIKHFK